MQHSSRVLATGSPSAPASSLSRSGTPERASLRPRSPCTLPNCSWNVAGIADGAGGIGQVTLHALGYPVEGIGTEAITAVELELLRRSQQPQVALLYEVQERHATFAVAAGDGIYQA